MTKTVKRLTVLPTVARAEFIDKFILFFTINHFYDNLFKCIQTQSFAILL